MLTENGREGVGGGFSMLFFFVLFCLNTAKGSGNINLFIINTSRKNKEASRERCSYTKVRKGGTEAQSTGGGEGEEDAVLLNWSLGKHLMGKIRVNDWMRERPSFLQWSRKWCAPLIRKYGKNQVEHLIERGGAVLGLLSGLGCRFKKKKNPDDL